MIGGCGPRFLAHYSEQDMAGKLVAAGFTLARAPANLGHLATLVRKMPEAMRPTA
jgi:hypothetical protein